MLLKLLNRYKSSVFFRKSAYFTENEFTKALDRENIALLNLQAWIVNLNVILYYALSFDKLLRLLPRGSYCVRKDGIQPQRLNRRRYFIKFLLWNIILRKNIAYLNAVFSYF